MAAEAALAGCQASTFAPVSLPGVLPGAEVLSVEANPVLHQSGFAPGTLRWVAPDVVVDDVSYCNVTITYTHPGQGDSITVETWLPPSSSSNDGIPNAWNSRLLAVGGGGFSAGRSVVMTGPAMLAAAAEGYATATTDGGLLPGPAGFPTGDWGLLSPGNVDLYAVQNFGHVALNDMAVLAKAAIAAFYNSPSDEEGPAEEGEGGGEGEEGEKLEYSYFVGCSGGGRQGLVLAQRYPDAFDGISANAPAVGWTGVASGLFWPYQAMQNLLQQGGDVPRQCEVDAISAAARAFCDGLDGVEDGIVSDPAACRARFDVDAQVGREVPCPFFPPMPSLFPLAGPGEEEEGEKPEVKEEKKDEEPETVTITAAAAAVVRAAWDGPVGVDGTSLWPGFSASADLTGNEPGSFSQPATVLTQCSHDPSSSSSSPSSEICHPAMPQLGQSWMQYFAAASPDPSSVSSLAHAGYESLVLRARARFSSFLDGDDPDLSAFRARGGKMLTFHGLDDQLLPPGGMEAYYRSVAAATTATAAVGGQQQQARVHDFFRYFEVPGLGHCFGGPGGVGQPSGMLAQLRAWVENGTAPESSVVRVDGAKNGSPGFTSRPGGGGDMVICPYPQKARLTACDDVGDAECWACVGDLAVMTAGGTSWMGDAVGDVWRAAVGGMGYL